MEPDETIERYQSGSQRCIDSTVLFSVHSPCCAGLPEKGLVMPDFGLFPKASVPIILRAYQFEAVEDLRAAFIRCRRVLFVLPTGGGKTVMVADITQQAMAKGKRVIILAHRQEIVDQISDALTAMGVAHGRIQPGHPMIDDLVQVAMVQTLARRLESIAPPDLLVFDEAHHAVAGSWAKITAKWPNAKVLGVTATPERLDGVGLGEAFDELVVGPDMRTLIYAGHLAQYIYLAPNTAIDLSNVRSVGGDFNGGDLERAIDQTAITGDAVQHYQKYLAGRTAIVFCVTVAHARRVALQFRDSGISAASIDGTMPAAQRRDLIAKLRNGDIRVLTSCDIISEGFDVPAVGGAILLRPTKSFALFRQQVGRCLRPKPDGSPAIILDHVGNVFRHGLPDMPYEWSLNSKSRAQADLQQASAGCRMCKACHRIVQPGSGRDMCPTPDTDGCLFRRPRDLPECDGQLEVVDQPSWANGINIREACGPERAQMMQHAGKNPARLREIQVARGYKPGWVHYAIRDASEPTS